MTLPDLSRELKAHADGLIVCGIDEAGRGPWAGPVVAAAVILDRHKLPAGLNDSKKLSKQKREDLFHAITTSSQFGVGIVPASRIDEINILQATYEAMQAAMSKLAATPHLALIDGNRAPELSCAVQTVIGGDGKSLSIAAASIIAKVTRDRMMMELDRKFPGYGFAAHKGYGTALHAAALARLGPCPEHRESFAPIREILAR